METKFKFNSQVCTDKNQSERLLALGLKKETADMRLIVNDFGDVLVARPLDYVYSHQPEHIPAWSLHRLLMMATSKRKVMLIRCESDLFDVVIKKIEREIKEGYFNKEYLV